MLHFLKISALTLLAALVLLIIGLNLWGAATLGSHSPQASAKRDGQANRVVMVFGATGSVGDGLLKAALQDPEVTTVYAVTRRLSPRLQAAQAAGQVQVILHEDFTDYRGMEDVLATVNTVLWGLGTTSIGMDPETYRHIHEDFPTAFVAAWLAARKAGPMAFHYVTGMGTGEAESAQWAQAKGRAERRVAEMAEGTGLRTFGHRSVWIRPTDENAHLGTRLLEPLLQPGHLVIRAVDLGRAMLEISARTAELPNGTLIDNRDALEYARVYRQHTGLGEAG
ncbi:NAD(P)H-binding protein [Parahaliea mediterranea]|uniref:NAD(P)H-binding protein n=1 Tax=Parahaliea mediterranea TaxID=651086 RepID=UPI000E2F96D7|nr:NAD(P)H-binding protein [Parahaliea mediterranea]